MTRATPPAPVTSLGDCAASPPSTRSRGWAWWICGLLMLATVVNYMDRQTLSVTARRIKSEMRLTNVSQELSVRHQGKVIGVLGTLAWVALSVLHPLFGRYIDATGSFDIGLAFVGWLPLASWFVLLRFWP
jgi:hypothetical protein